MFANQVDDELIRAEQGASPERYQRRGSNEIERAITTESTSTTASTTSSIHARRETVHRSISRIPTQHDLERHPTALSRIATQRSQHLQTVGASERTISRASRRPLPPFGGGKDYPPLLPEREEYVVEFDGPDDPLHAQNWPLGKKLITAGVLVYTTLISAFTSSIFSTATATIARDFDVGLEVALLGTSFFVLGFAFGPTLWAPFSELKGRRLPIVIAVFGFSVFAIATATAKDIQTILICRFFGGFFGSCPLAVVAAVFSDLFNNETRGIAITLYSLATFTGPLCAPFIGGFIVDSSLGWRWVEYLPSILGWVAFVLNLFLLEETYPPAILVGKAAELRRRTKNWGIHAKQEEIEVDLVELLTKNFSRPLRLLFTEPVILLLSIYIAFVYGLLYLFLTAYQLVFVGVHGFNLGESGLTEIGLVVGQVLAAITIIAQQPWYNRKLRANHGIPVPEWRLPSMMVGSVFFAIGIFWFGWTGFTRDITWVAPALSGIFTGFGLLCIFLQALNYIIDAYLMFAASAIAANTFLRSLCAASFPLFARQMFTGMHIQWASTLLGCIAVGLIPIPFIFYFYGARIRARSEIAPQFAAPANSGLRGPDTAEDTSDMEKESDEAAASSAPRRTSDIDGPSSSV